MSKQYKIIHEDEHIYHIQHPDGSQFPVAKSALSKSAQAKVKSFCSGGKVQKFDEGGQVKPEGLDLVGDLTGTQYPAQPAGDPALNAQGVPPMLQAPQAQPAPSAPVQEGRISSDESPMDQDIYAIPGIKERMAGLEGAANAQMTGAKADAGIISNYQKQLQDQAALEQKHYSDFSAAHDDLVKKINDQKIDPNRFYKDMSTGQKVAGGIALILGGIGAGLTHQPNAALEMINRLQDKDIEAQKADLGKTQTLYSMNLQKYGDQRAADAATRLQMNAALQAQLQGAAAKQTSEMAKANLMQQVGVLKEQSVPLIQQMAQYKTLKAMSSGAVSPQAYEMLPKDARERAVTVTGPNGMPRLALARTPQAAEEFSKVQNLTKELNNKADEALKFMDETGTTYNPFGEAAGKADTIHNAMILSLGKLEDLARFTPEEHKLFSGMVPNPGQWNTSKGKAQLMTLKKMINDKLNSASASYLENYNPGGVKLQKPVR